MSGKQRHLRKRRALDDDDDEQRGEDGARDTENEARQEVLEDLRLLQRARRRQPGLDAARLVPTADDDEDDDGADNELMNAQYVKAEGTAKSQILDEETHMQRFVEQELAKRLGRNTNESAAAPLSKAAQQERALYELPEGLQASLTQDVTLPGMMTAITEVEVSRDAKLRKIEETEAAKAQLLAVQTGRQEGDDGDGGAKLRRGMFARSFGKKQQRLYAGVDPDRVHEARRVISEHSRDPKDVARERHLRSLGR